MSCVLDLESYSVQIKRWPATGRHILANFDDDSIIVYQAFNSLIANAAVTSQNFNSDKCLNNGYNLGRMSWIKTNFLWMMYRAGWATKQNQEKILAIRITRKGFEEILSKCVLSSHDGDEKKCNKDDEARLQWDPDHLPNGDKVPTGRRAIQIGLRNEMLKKFCDEFILNIYDITDFVVEQRKNCIDTKDYTSLSIPIENVYKINDHSIISNIRLDEN